MELKERVLKTANSFVNTLIVIILLTASLYAGYSLWDNYRVYNEAEDVQADLLQFKPDISSGNQKKISQSFEELRAVNKDVCAWLTIDNTKIDYPVLQGKDNFAYINTNVYGEFSLSGSLFLDTRCSRDFSDMYSLIYGHHISNGNMFGDLDKFKQKSFFQKNKTGVLITPKKTYNLKIFAVLIVPDSNDVIFNPETNTEISRISDCVNTWSLFKDEKRIKIIQNKGNKAQIVSLSTCSSEFTDARTVLLAQMIPKK